MAFKTNDGKVEVDFVEPIDGDGDITDEMWLQICRRGWQRGDDWFNGSLRPRIERNLAHYKSKHEPGSKYHREEFRKRSRFFRPRTRTAIRKIVAAGTRAFFATEDVVHCSATDDGNPENVLAAEIHQMILNHRLKNQVPWYKITVAALTDVAINGVVISKQYWDFEEEEVEQVRAETTDEGLSVNRDVMRRMRHDRPMSRIVPIENIRISPASDWSDPMNTTPYIIEKRPYYLTDLRERMQNNKVIPYRNLDDSELKQGEQAQDDSLRSKREHNRDRYTDSTGAGDDYDIVWVRECIVRIGAMDWYFETVGTTLLLSDPVPLTRINRIGRSYVMGYLEIEPHTLSPDGPADLGAGLQRESNELANSRMDNVKLSMTGRFIVSRGHQTDIASLMRNVPGSVTFTQNATQDVRDMRPADVTQSSYQEQDRLNLDMDDLLGTFSQSTVQSNRAMNETVGGMQMLNEGANELTEFQIRNFTETWYQPVLRQLVELERYYESSTNILKIAGDGYGQSIAQTFQLVQQPTNVVVNVGFGNLNPIQRIERLSMGLTTMENFSPGTLAKLDQREVAKEVFGALGFKDGTRFLPHLDKDGEDPRIAQLEEQIAELSQIIEGKQVEQQGKLQIEQLRVEGKLRIEQMRQQFNAYIEQMRSQLKEVESQIKQEDNEINKRQLWMQREALSHTIQMEERRFEMEELRFMAEMGLPIGQPSVGQPELGNTDLVQSLRDPSSGQPIPSSDPAQTPGQSPIVEMRDDPGVLARGQYGNIPFMEG